MTYAQDFLIMPWEAPLPPLEFLGVVLDKAVRLFTAEILLRGTLVPLLANQIADEISQASTQYLLKVLFC
jgi:hypothetical protein